MNSINFVLFLCIPALVFADTFAYPDDGPEASCHCIPLQQCPSVLSGLESSYKRDHVTHKAFTNYLNIINCGYNGTEPCICCPKEIPSKVVKIVENKKYWTKSREQNSLKKLRLAVSEAKNSKFATTEGPLLKMNPVQDYFNSPPGELKVPYQFPGCGVYGWVEDFGNRTSIGDYPWVALLEYETPGNGKQLLCGGVLISDQHILTAARCLTSPANKLTAVILGEYDTNANPECMDEGANNPPFCVNSTRKYEIERSITHDKYDDGVSHRDDFLLSDVVESSLHDIALIKLKTKVQLSAYIKPICLPLEKPKTKRFQVAGWGRSFVPQNYGHNFKLVSYLSECKRSDSSRREIEQLFDKKEHICAGLRRQQPCIVDSGGPLMADERKPDGTRRMTVFGISFMESTCRDFPGKPKNLPGIFTNVYNYKDWIVKNMNV